MSTLAIRIRRSIYLGITIFVVIFALVYEHFSHGVISYFMIFAFAIPLAGGIAAEIIARASRSNYKRLSLQMLAGTVTWFTLGFIYDGVLEIYGTTNRLLIVFWIVGGIQLILTIITAAIHGKKKQRIQRL